jgi:hypothetical protein
MSSLDILAMASPESRYYKRDRDIMKDYDTKINQYNTALETFKPLAEQYQTAVDAYNEQINTFNTGLDKYKADAEAFNAAIARYNEGPRTTAYEEMDYYVARPAEFTMTPPEFTGGDAPVAPEDPGFTGEDVDAFVEQAGQRAMRRGATMATAQNIMTNPQGNYAAGVDSTVPEFSFSSMAMAEGGMVPSLPFANSIVAPMVGGIGQLTNSQKSPNIGTFQREPLTLPTPETPYGGDNFGIKSAAPELTERGTFFNEQGIEMMPQMGFGGGTAIPYSQQNNMSTPSTGIGGLFENQFQKPQTQGLGAMQNAQNSQMRQSFDQQMNQMRSQPLQVYGSYLNETYTAPQAQAMQKRVDEFVDLVKQAEAAHFGTSG